MCIDKLGNIISLNKFDNMSYLIVTSVLLDFCWTICSLTVSIILQVNKIVQVLLLHMLFCFPNALRYNSCVQNLLEFSFDVCGRAYLMLYFFLDVSRCFARRIIFVLCSFNYINQSIDLARYVVKRRQSQFNLFTKLPQCWPNTLEKISTCTANFYCMRHHLYIYIYI